VISVRFSFFKKWIVQPYFKILSLTLTTL
jgi:hypothetical protein